MLSFISERIEAIRYILKKERSEKLQQIKSSYLLKIPDMKYTELYGTKIIQKEL